eukprot:TRINITY_DN7446_c0_g2_i4.p1 TRINITY_DN7446_c0_g2~~TRINITY_DN7446_c0_g2_i4.p1  ORF type:complete len:230 (-),score=33.22 TRINITY_DN7446_c0_g2_i4:200-889(-)
MGLVRGFLVQVFLLIPVVLTLVLAFRADFGPKDNPDGKGLWIHISCAVIAFAYFLPNAVLSYSCSFLERATRKKFHVLFQTLAFFAGLIAVINIFSYHSKFRYPDLYSVHSVLGLPFIIIFTVQYAFSFLLYFWPGASAERRQSTIGYHKHIGTILLLLALTVLMSGAMDLQRIVGFTEPYSPSNRILAALGIFFFVSAVIVASYLKSASSAKPEQDQADNEQLMAQNA